MVQLEPKSEGFGKFIFPHLFSKEHRHVNVYTDPLLGEEEFDFLTWFGLKKQFSMLILWV